MTSIFVGFYVKEIIYVFTICILYITTTIGFLHVKKFPWKILLRFQSVKLLYLHLMENDDDDEM